MKKIKLTTAIPFLSFVMLIPTISSCHSPNNRDWKNGVNFLDLKIGDDLAGKSISFDMLKPWYSVNYRSSPSIFIEFAIGDGSIVSFALDKYPNESYPCLLFSESSSELISVYDNSQYYWGQGSFPYNPHYKAKSSWNKWIVKIEYSKFIIQSLWINMSLENDNLNDFILNNVKFGYLW